jgi:hypothetical protein
VAPPSWLFTHGQPTNTPKQVALLCVPRERADPSRCHLNGLVTEQICYLSTCKVRLQLLVALGNWDMGVNEIVLVLSQIS